MQYYDIRVLIELATEISLLSVFSYIGFFSSDSLMYALFDCAHGFSSSCTRFESSARVQSTTLATRILPAAQ